MFRRHQLGNPCTHSHTFLRAMATRMACHCTKAVVRAMLAMTYLREQQHQRQGGERGASATVVAAAAGGSTTGPSGQPSLGARMPSRAPDLTHTGPGRPGRAPPVGHLDVLPTCRPATASGAQKPSVWPCSW